MKKINVQVLTLVAALAVVFTLCLSANAQSADLYKSKCAMCHGADGAKAAGHDFSSADVQKKTDAELTDVINNGKGKMPKYADKLKPEEVKGLVAYIRTLKK
jgi:cytochrome c6